MLMDTTIWQLSTWSALTARKKSSAGASPSCSSWTSGPAVLTYRLACDNRVVQLLRSRGLGNGPSFQLQRKLHEQHSEAWLQKTAHYLSQCQEFSQARHTDSFPAPPLTIPSQCRPSIITTGFCRFTVTMSCSASTKPRQP